MTENRVRVVTKKLSRETAERLLAVIEESDVLRAKPFRIEEVENR